MSLVTLTLPATPSRVARALLAAKEPGGWIALVKPFTVLRQRVRRTVAAAARARPDIDLFFGQDGLWLGGPRIPKPAAGMILLAALDIVGLPLLIRASALAALGGVRPATGLAGGYDLALRAVANGLVVEHLSLHLAHIMPPRALSGPARLDVLNGWNADAGHPWRISAGLAPATFQLRRAFAAPPRVTILVRPGPGTEPTAQRLGPVLDALARGPWPLDRLEVIADPRLDTGGADAGTQPVSWRRASVHVSAGEADHRNALWRAAPSELVVFTEAGLTPETPDWIDALVGLAADRNVGMVSGRVLDGQQDAPEAAAALFGFDPATWPDRGFVHREFAVPTSPLIAARKSALEAVNGFSPNLPSAYQAAQMALRMRLLGQSIVTTPFAVARRAPCAAPVPDPMAEAAFKAQWGTVITDDRLHFPDAPLRAPR
ncbi:hypothetical protein [Azorhizobium sp. AG788]|uniref:hypothetical protein n=1 Tax=Azorhizobium sp. AG788 TaxID=2183897 RepID=UPI00313920CF